MIDEKIIAAVRTALCALSPAAVYVFGSTAANRNRPDSDIDLAVLPSNALSVTEMLRISSELSETLDRDIDIVDLNRASTVLRKEIIVTGDLVYETDRHRRQEFEMYALSDYARLNEERAPVLQALGQPLRS